MSHYPGHLAFLEEAASQLGVSDRSVIDQARRLAPLANLSSLIGQAYEASRLPAHRAVDLSIAARQLAVLETAVTAARAILLRARADLDEPPPPLVLQAGPDTPRARGSRNRA